MFKPIACGILLIAFVTANVVPKVPNDISAQVTVVNDDSELMSLKKQGIDLIPLSSIQETAKIRYFMGKRIPNDQLVSLSSHNSTFCTPQDVQIRLEYGKSGQGAVISYAEIAINQTSFTSKAFLISGGVGQRTLVVVIEAPKTLEFNYAAKVYGTY